MVKLDMFSVTEHEVQKLKCPLTEIGGKGTLGYMQVYNFLVSIITSLT